MQKRAEEEKPAELTPEEMKAKIAALEAENAELKSKAEAEKPAETSTDTAEENKECGGEDKTETRSIEPKKDTTMKHEPETEVRSLNVPYIKPNTTREYNIGNVLASMVGGKADISYEMERSDALFEEMNMQPSRTSIMANSLAVIFAAAR